VLTVHYKEQKAEMYHNFYTAKWSDNVIDVSTKIAFPSINLKNNGSKEMVLNTIQLLRLVGMIPEYSRVVGTPVVYPEEWKFLQQRSHCKKRTLSHSTLSYRRRVKGNKKVKKRARKYLIKSCSHHSIPAGRLKRATAAMAVLITVCNAFHIQGDMFKCPNLPTLVKVMLSLTYD